MKATACIVLSNTVMCFFRQPGRFWPAPSRMQSITVPETGSPRRELSFSSYPSLSPLTYRPSMAWVTPSRQSGDSPID